MFGFTWPASADTPDAYYARHAARRSSGLTRMSAAADFVWSRAVLSEEKREQRLHSGLSVGQKHLTCSLSLILPDLGGAFVQEVATRILDRSGATDRAAIVHLLTTGESCPRRMVEPAPAIAPTLLIIPIDARGIPLSSNPVWNACVRRQGLSFDLIQSNTDRFEHRRGKVRITRPLSCRDYHRGSVAFWKYPDQPDLELLLDRRGKFLGAIGDSVSPVLYVAVRKK